MPEDSLSLFLRYFNCDFMNDIKSRDERTLIGCLFINCSHVYKCKIVFVSQATKSTHLIF